MRGPQPGPKPSNPGGIQASQGACCPLPPSFLTGASQPSQRAQRSKALDGCGQGPGIPAAMTSVAPLTRVNAERQECCRHCFSARSTGYRQAPGTAELALESRSNQHTEHQHTEHRHVTCLPPRASSDRRRTGLWCLYLRGIHESYKVGGTHSTLRPMPNTQHPTP
jgi:hypothetical protein